MSNIYIQEPPTSGKVLLQTTVGDIDIELWSKETPKACRNFIQLCLENYYDKTIFHRVIKGFIVQGGDPEGSGMGGESIYGKPFKDEFHSRLRFVRRGLVAMANAGKDDNGSQFFFTLGSCPELQNKHTIFGKVSGNTLFNMLKLEDSLVDQNDKPLYPHKIISVKVLFNPFSDIIPRALKIEETPIKEKIQMKAKKNFSLLSFGEEAEEEEAETDAVVQVYRGKSKSSHDLTKDPKLSSVPAIALYEDGKHTSNSDSSTLENIRKKLKKETTQEPTNDEIPKKLSVTNKSNKTLVKSEDNEVEDEREEVRKQIKQLKRELKGKSHKTEVKELEMPVKVEEEKEENSILVAFHKQAIEYREKSSKILPKGSERQEQTMALLAKFQSKLETANQSTQELAKKSYDTDDDNDDDNDEGWLTHTFQTEEETLVIAKDANLPSEDRYDISDPRNPINQRRRHANKHDTKQKR